MAMSANSPPTFCLPFNRKQAAPIARFIVPNGCSEIHIRWFIFSLSGLSLNLTTFSFQNGTLPSSGSFFLVSLFLLLSFPLLPVSTTLLSFPGCLCQNPFPSSSCFPSRSHTYHGMGIPCTPACWHILSPHFFDAFSPEDFPSGTVNQIPFRIPDKYPSPARFFISSSVP